MSGISARLALFSAIEGGHTFWSQEISTNGVEYVYKKLQAAGYDPIKYGKTIERVRSANEKDIFESITNVDAHFITPEMEQWPTQLNELAAIPIALVVKGEPSALKEKSLAIVGTRNPTPYGVRNAGDFAAGFVDREWTIVSGGAYGIDSAAHKGALIAEGSTVAVLAAGIDVAYPAGNARLFAEICENGALVSEVLPGAHAIPSRFLTRNRIIAALSQATLVVEAAFRSGSLRTARDAAELMRPVMAIPGPISAPTSEGCHRLIGERSAELVTSVPDAVELISTL
jgi:DNA protecting protein DprA